MYSNLNGDEEGLVGYWDFNEGEGINLADLSDNGNDGTIYGATWSGDVSTPPVFGCTDTLDVLLTVIPKPSINVTNNPSVCTGLSTSLVVSGTNSYNWFPSSGLNNTIGSVAKTVAMLI